MGFGISENLNNKLVVKQEKTESISQNKNKLPVFEIKRPTVVVFDSFGDKLIPIDPYDSIPDMSHGEAVESYVKAQCPAVKIERRGKFTPTTEAEKKEVLKELQDILNKGSAEEKLLFGEDTKRLIDHPNNILKFNTRKGLKELAQSVEKGARFDTVNFSMSNDVKIKNLAKVTGLPLTKENLSQYKDKIRKWIKNNNSQEIKELNEILESIEKITAKGIPFYVAAGNAGNNQVNLVSFAKGVTTIGALEKDKKNKTTYSADNSLVTRWAQGTYSSDKVKNIDGEIGYDINGDNEPEILAKDTSSKFLLLKSVLNKKIDNKVWGTSFATPAVVGKDLRTKFGSACDQ